MEVGTTRGGEERETRSLSAPVMRFELAAEAARLRAEQPFAEGDRNARTLVKVGAFRLVLVTLRSGAAFSESVARTIDRSGSAGGFAKVPERTTAARSPNPLRTADAECPASGRPTSSVGGGVAMHARQSTLQGKPDQLEAGIKNFNQEILPAIKQLKGFTGAQFLADRKTGKVVVTTYWETEQALRDSEAKANDLRKTAAAQVGSTGTPVVERFEVVMADIKQAVHA